MLANLDIPFVFKRRPAPVPGDLRPAWRIALILLILFQSRQKKASLRKLHVISWAARSPINRAALIRYSKNDIPKDQIIPRVEPSLNLETMLRGLPVNVISVDGRVIKNLS